MHFGIRGKDYYHWLPEFVIGVQKTKFDGWADEYQRSSDLLKLFQDNKIFDGADLSREERAFVLCALDHQKDALLSAQYALHQASSNGKHFVPEQLRVVDSVVEATVGAYYAFAFNNANSFNSYIDQINESLQRDFSVISNLVYEHSNYLPSKVRELDNPLVIAAHSLSLLSQMNDKSIDSYGSVMTFPFGSSEMGYALKAIGRITRGSDVVDSVVHCNFSSQRLVRGQVKEEDLSRDALWPLHYIPIHQRSYIEAMVTGNKPLLLLDNNSTTFGTLDRIKRAFFTNGVNTHASVAEVFYTNAAKYLLGQPSEPLVENWEKALDYRPLSDYFSAYNTWGTGVTNWHLKRLFHRNFPKKAEPLLAHNITDVGQGFSGVDILSEIRILHPELPRVVFFGGAHEMRGVPVGTVRQSLRRIATTIRQELKTPFVVLTGGEGKPGASTVMKLINSTSSEVGAITVGIITLPEAKNAQTTTLDHIVVGSTPEDRLQVLADVEGLKIVIAFPGGFGTEEEIFSFLRKMQTDRVHGRGQGEIAPVVLYNLVPGYWDELDKQLKSQVRSGLLQPWAYRMVKVCRTSEEILTFWKSFEEEIKPKLPSREERNLLAMPPETEDRKRPLLHYETLELPTSISPAGDSVGIKVCRVQNLYDLQVALVGGATMIGVHAVAADRQSYLARNPLPNNVDSTSFGQNIHPRLPLPVWELTGIQHMMRRIPKGLDVAVLFEKELEPDLIRQTLKTFYALSDEVPYSSLLLQFQHRTTPEALNSVRTISSDLRLMPVAGLFQDDLIPYLRGLTHMFHQGDAILIDMGKHQPDLISGKNPHETTLPDRLNRLIDVAPDLSSLQVPLFLGGGISSQNVAY
ncbi:MAG: LOG family protein, partial [bacterium]